MDLTDAQWAVLEPLFRPPRRADGRGRPWQETRAVLNGVFWDLGTGAPWARSAASLSALPNLSSPLPTVAAFRAAHAVAARVGRRFARPRKTRSERVVHRRQLQLGEKRGSAVGPTRRGKGSKIMAISDGHGLPLAVHMASA
jgi:transposase